MEEPAFNVIIMDYFLQNYTLNLLRLVNLQDHLLECTQVAQFCFKHFTKNEDIAAAVAIYNFFKHNVSTDIIYNSFKELASFFGVQHSLIATCWNSLEISRHKTHIESASFQNNEDDEEMSSPLLKKAK